MKYVAISSLYSHFVNSIYGLTGINKYLIKAGVALMIIPFLWGLRLIFSLNRSRRNVGYLILTVFFIGYNLSLYQFTKTSYFSFSKGEVLKWYALTPEGVKFYDSAGVDPVYGITLRPVTPEVIRNLKRLEKGDFKPIDPANAQFFNPITGEAQVWFYQYPEGNYEFYDKPGYHPITGEPLNPVTKQIYFKWRDKSKLKEEQNPVPPIVEQKETGTAMAPTPLLSEKKEFENNLNPESTKREVHEFIQSYFNVVEKNDLEGLLTHYGEKVNYFSKGLVSKNFIRKDKESYIKKWPQIITSLNGPIELAVNRDSISAQFPIDFFVQNSQKSIKGKAINYWKLQKIGNSLKIIDEKQNVLTREIN